MKEHDQFYGNQAITLTSERDIFTYAFKNIQALGFSHFMLRKIPPYGNIETNSKILSNHSIEFLSAYAKNHLALKNPIYAHCQVSSVPRIWDQEDFREVPELWSVTQTHGLHYGWSQAVHDINGAVSMLVLSRRHPAVTENEFIEKAAKVLWLCNQLHNTLTPQTLQPPKRQPQNIRLSSRETEVLKWTAEGKTASDIGKILNLATRTVNFHISSVIRKIGACNKTSAVMIATKSGLL